jgi:hypothetical protein
MTGGVSNLFLAKQNNHLHAHLVCYWTLPNPKSVNHPVTAWPTHPEKTKHELICV